MENIVQTDIAVWASTRADAIIALEELLAELRDMSPEEWVTIPTRPLRFIRRRISDDRTLERFV